MTSSRIVVLPKLAGKEKIADSIIKGTRKHKVSRSAVRLGICLSVLFILAVVMMAVSSPLTSALAKKRTQAKPPGSAIQISSDPKTDGERQILNLRRRQSPRPVTLNFVKGMFSPLLPLPGDEQIETFASDCTTPKTDFNLGETICVKVTGAPVFGHRFNWGHPDGVLARDLDISSATQTDTLVIPATSVIGGETRSNRGTWRISATDFDAIPRSVAYFTLHDPDTPTGDLNVYKFLNGGDTQVNEDTDVDFTISVFNQGPDAAENVHLADVTPAVTTFVSLMQDSGPAFSCTDSDCTIASLPKGALATFTARYHTNGVVANTLTTYSASISSDTADLRPADNSAAGEFTITVTGATTACTLLCPGNINALANTTEGGIRGAHVTFAAAEPSGDCGAVMATPSSGSFFPEGTTTVNVTSETGGGSCSFTITITDNGTNPPTISCPADLSATANSNCEASVSLGVPSTTGDNVTVIGIRSDGKPMYNCDSNGDNCVRRVPDDPFPAGITTVTWTAYSHDVAGPFPISAEEQAHRTGSASCAQRVTVNDVVPPVINVAPQTVSVDASCQAVVPDFTATAMVSDNCACSSSDTSEACLDREPITVIQTPAAGTVVGLGDHTITLTANDGSSNNNGAGNTATVTTTLTVVDTTPPTITLTGADPQYVECHTSYSELGATANDNCSGSFAATPSGSVNVNVVGTYTITYNATDGAGNPATPVTRTVIVQDTIAPTITLNGQAHSMWPPNHKYVTFQVTDFVSSVTDSCNTGLGVGDVVIEKVTSDEIENGNGDGNTFNDIVIASNCRSVDLRREREGASDGRVYTITFKVSDGYNVTRATATVVVPLNIGQTPVDSGIHYTVNGSCP